MPRWDERTKQYEAESLNTVYPDKEREERFRTALLNELDALVTAIRNLDLPTKGPAK